MTIINQDDIRLSDLAFSEEKRTSIFIENQFPAIYRENGRELVELVKSYYRFLEDNELQSTYNVRRMYEYRDIDQTLEKMIIFFKNKFMSGLFFDKDVRFSIKHILDLYRRKGSKEGIELFFKLFFDSETTVYFPSEDILKPSTSLWKSGSFIQLYGVSDTSVFNDIVNKRIFGDKSNSDAFVDSVYFINIDSYTIPILFLSGVRGRFQGFDVIFRDDPIKIYGRVYGSMQEVAPILEETFTGGNVIGDTVEIQSPTGTGATGRVAAVSENLSGQISFDILDGGFGYTDANTTIEVSTQTVFFRDPDPTIVQPDIQFFVGERVKQTNGANIVVEGTVVGQKKTAVGIKLDYTIPGSTIPGSLPNTTVPSPTYVLDATSPISTFDRIINISYTPVFVTPPNNTASALIGKGSVTDTENITIITDIISNYRNVRLDSANYSAPPAVIPMSGTRVNGVIPILSTRLNQAFVPENFDIGRISKFLSFDPGTDYRSDVFVLARENIISRFSLRNQVLRIIQSAGIILFTGDTVTQKRLVKRFNGTVVEIEVRGRVVNTIGNEIYVKQLTFESFVITSPIFKLGSDIPIQVVSRSRDQTSLPLGLNAKISGNVETITGKINKIDVLSSGFGYIHNSVGDVYNITKRERVGANNLNIPDCKVLINARDQGVTEGRWESFFSHISQDKVIQDSFFYQDYSYEITTDVSPAEYKMEYMDLIHPSGLKLFGRFGKTDSVVFSPVIRSLDISAYALDDETQVMKSEFDSVVIGENGFAYIVSQLNPTDLSQISPGTANSGNGSVVIRATTDSTQITIDTTKITTDRV